MEQIDALLVAYPKLDSANNVVDGRIYTCWYAGIDASKTHFNTCNKQLVVNGALIAEKVLFGRVHASVKQEVITPPTPPIASVYNRRVSGDACTVYETQFPTATNTRSIPSLQIIPGTFSPTSATAPYYIWIPATGWSGTYHYYYYAFNGVEWGFYWARDGTSPSTCAHKGHLLQMNVWRPGDGLGNNRGRAAIWLARALNDGQDPPTPAPGTPSPFTDVDDSQDWWPHVVFLANHPNVGIDLLGYKGGTAFIDNPTLFEPSSTPVKAWVAVLLAEAYNIPKADTFVTYHSGPGSVDTVFDDLRSLAYEYRIRRAIHGLAVATNRRGMRNCDQALYNRPGGWNTSIYAGCIFQPSSNIGTGVFARMLIESIQWSYNNGGGQPINVRPTTKASEVINFLPEYFIGTPELPLFADQVYKTDSFLNKPSNF